MFETHRLQVLGKATLCRHLAASEGPRISHRRLHQVRDGPTLLARDSPQPLVDPLVEIELRPDHAMYIHRHLDAVNEVASHPAARQRPGPG